MEREWDIYYVYFASFWRLENAEIVWSDAMAASRWRMYRAYNETITIMHHGRETSIPLRRNVSLIIASFMHFLVRSRK